MRSRSSDQGYELTRPSELDGLLPSPMLPAAKQQKRSHHVKPVADSRARPITSFFSRPPPPSNDAERRRRLKNQLQLTASLAAINKEKDNAKAASNSLETAKLIEAAPAALVKLKEKDSDYSKLTMPEMCAIAFKHFKGV